MRAFVGCCLFAATLLAAGSALAQGGGAGTLTIGISQFPPTLHPSMEASVAKSYVLGMAHRPFTAFDPDWQLVCMLCVTLPTLENGQAVREETPEGRPGIAVTYRIQPGARWGDGTPLTSADVRFTWEVGRHPQSAFDNAELYRSIDRIDTPDEQTFILHVNKVTFDYNAINDLLVLPAHLERPVFAADPVTYRNRTLYNADPTNPGLYFGPYRIVRVDSGSAIVLEPNPTWYGPPPAFDRIVVRSIENTAALEANLRAGGIDMIAGELGVTLDQALALERRLGDRFRVLYQPGLTFEHIDLNLDNPILADRRVRQALLHALDRETMVRQLFQDRQPVAHGPVPPLDWVHDPGLRQYPHDPARANALLDEAGFTERRNGIRHDSQGRRLSLAFMTTAGNRSRELVQQVLQAHWRAVGVEAVIRNEPARVFFGRTLSQRAFEAMAMFAFVSSPENVPRTILHSDHIPTPENNWAGQNYPGFRNAEMDRLIEAIEIELDRERRRALWHRLQALYAEELPALPLYYRADAFILPRWLEGVRPTGHLHGTTLWVEQWRRAE